MKRNIPQTITGKWNNLPWITDAVKKYSDERQGVQKAKRRLWEAYRALRNSTTRAIWRAHECYIQDIIGDLDSATQNDQFAGIKRLWGYVKSNKRECVGVATLRTQHGQHHTDIDKAKVLNNQFEGACTRESTDNVPSLGESPYPLCPDTIFTSLSIIKLLKKPATTLGHNAWLSPSQDTAWHCRSDSPTPHFDIPTDLWHRKYTTRLEGCDYPHIHKGCKHDPQNYRPVLLTSIACKIHEHILCSTMMSHLDTCAILTNDQHGFRKGLSTETQLLAAVHDCPTHCTRGQTDILFLDFSKAFNS